MDLCRFPAIAHSRDTVRARTGALFLALLAATGGASAGTPVAMPLPPAESLVAANAAPLKLVRVFRVYGWQALDGRTGVLWLGVDEPYLIRTGTACGKADGDVPSALALRDSHLVPGRDRLLFASGSCTIDSLMRADRNKLRASSITPDAASAVRLIQDAVPRKSR